MLTLNLLGTPRLAMDDEPVVLSPSATMLCAYLALAPRGGRARAVAASQLFGDCPEATARRRLNTALWRLRTEGRSTIGVDLVGTTAAGREVALSDAVEVTVDAAVFADLVEPVLGSDPADLDADQVAGLAHAVALHRGHLLEACHEDWVMPERYRLENLYLTALDYLVQHHGAGGEVEPVARYGELALELEPLREDVHRHLMVAFAAAGRIDLVERQYERCRRVLLDELGADPLPETTALYSRLARRTGPGAAPGTVAGLLAELERADEELARLGAIVERARQQLRRLA